MPAGARKPGQLYLSTKRIIQGSCAVCVRVRVRARAPNPAPIAN